MTDKQKQWFAWGIIALVMTLVSVFLGVKYPIPEPPPFLPDEEVILGTTHFTNISVEDATVTDDLAVTDDASVGGDLTVTGALAPNGNVTYSALTIFSSTTITVTDAQTITPTVTIYNLDSAGAVTITLAACTTDGQPLILVGDDANNITINDTNVRTNDGSVQVIGQYDIITWVCIDTEWIEISDVANS